MTETCQACGEKFDRTEEAGNCAPICAQCMDEIVELKKAERVARAWPLSDAESLARAVNDLLEGLAEQDLEPGKFLRELADRVGKRDPP